MQFLKFVILEMLIMFRKFLNTYEIQLFAYLPHEILCPITWFFEEQLIFCSWSFAIP
jgi:hypothetical protein